MAFAFAAGDLLIETNRDGIITFCVGAARSLLDVSTDQLLGITFEDLVAEEDRSLVHHLMRLIPPGTRRGPLAIELQHGEIFKTATLHAFRPVSHSDMVYVSVTSGLIQVVRHEDDARDFETGLLRKETFVKVADDLLRRADAANSTLSLTQIGIPGLAELSARHGGTAVSAFLTEAASLLRSFAYGDAATRIGNDKYAVLHDASISGDQIASELQTLGNSGPNGIDVTITHKNVQGDAALNSEDATRALIYTINKFANSMEGPVEIDSLNTVIETQLSAAIDRITWFKRSVIDQDLHFVGQPIVWLNGGKVHHSEVLVRFQSNQSPFGHLQFAEQVGIIHELDLAVIEYVIAYLVERTERGEPVMPLAINVSATSFERTDFVVKLLKLLDNRLDQPDLLLFEITESAEIKSLERTNRVLQGLRKRGYRICLDDFGAGAASFQYLRGLDVDMVKIDGQYVKMAMQMRKEAEMLRAIAGLCKQLRIMTVAEQVESETQAKYLREVGVDLAQGYLFGKPQPLKLSMLKDSNEGQPRIATVA